MKKIYSAVITFFKSMASSFEKTEVVEDYKSSIKELKDTTLQMLGAMDPGLGADSSVSIHLSKSLRGKTAAPNQNVNSSLLNLAKKLADEENDISQIIEDSFDNIVVRESMDFGKLNILHYISAVRFFNKFVRKYTLAVVALENEKDGGKSLSSVDVEAIEFVNETTNLAAFSGIYAAMGIDSKDFAKALSALKPIRVDPELNERSMGLRPGSTDVLKVGFIPSFLSPYYLAGILRNKFLRYTYDSAQAEREKLELEIIYYKAAVDKENDPKKLLQYKKVLKKIDDRVNKLGARIEEIEEEAND